MLRLCSIAGVASIDLVSSMDSKKVFAGSADELESQQGMAHLVEHVAYMGSRKR